MWWPCAAECRPPGGQDGPVLPVRGDGPPQPGTGTLGPPPPSTGPLPAPAAAGNSTCCVLESLLVVVVYRILRENWLPLDFCGIKKIKSSSVGTFVFCYRFPFTCVFVVFLSAGSPHSLEETEATGREAGKSDTYLSFLPRRRPKAVTSKPRRGGLRSRCWSTFSSQLAPLAAVLTSDFTVVARGLDLTRLFLLLCIYILAKIKKQREGSQCVLEEKTNKHEGQTAFFRAWHQRHRR